MATVSLSEIAPSKLSVIGRTADGLGHAYTQIDLNGLNLTSIDGIEKYQHLRYIILSKNKLDDAGIAPLKNLNYILTLDISFNKLTSVLDSVDPRPYLQAIDLSNNEIAALSEIKHKQLTTMNLNRNKLTTLAGGLVGLEQLIVLEARGNKLENVTGVADASNLEELYLGENQLESFETIGALPKLMRLHARQNKLKSLAGLESMQSLASLNIRDNQIESLEEIARLKDLPFLRRLSTQGNPVCEKDNYRVEVALLLPKLEVLDKEPITTDEREEAKALADERRQAAEAAAAAAVEKGDEE